MMMMMVGEVVPFITTPDYDVYLEFRVESLRIEVRAEHGRDWVTVAVAQCDLVRRG